MIDNVDRELIRHLQSDGRMAYSALGKLVGLSDAATGQRVKRLISIGVINVVAITDPRKMGYGHQAMIGIKTTGDITAAARSVGSLPEAHYVVVTAGRFDIMVEVVCVDAQGLLDVANAIRQFNCVRYIEVTPYLTVTKETYNWGAGGQSDDRRMDLPA